MMTNPGSDHSVKVLFLGPEGTYSHQAALQQFGNNPKASLICTDSIPQCFEYLEQDESLDYSVVPLENSTNGQVVFTYDLLRDRMVENASRNVQDNQVIPSLEVVGEQYVSIKHCLICFKDISLASLSNYKRLRIYSHPQVWGQVNKYLQRLRKDYPETIVEKIDTLSTSKAVTQAAVAESKSEEASVLNLAIAGETAANLHNAHIIDRDINDVLGNTTRFLIFKRRNKKEAELTAGAKKVSLLTFTIKQDDPGSLVDVLTVLKEHAINMCSINSRPFNSKSHVRNWHYVFFIEFYHDEAETKWNSFYRAIADSCSSWCLWGTFARNEHYYN